MEEIMYLVKHKAELPKANKVIELQNAISNNIQKFKVGKIKELRWNAKGDLIITMSGRYV